MKIVVVDDNSFGLLLLKRFLSPYPIEITLFEDPVLALKHCEHHDFDILMTDHYMPKIDGCELLRLLKQSKKHPFVGVLITGDPTIQSDDADFNMTKPIMSEPFHAFMQEHMKKELLIK